MRDLHIEPITALPNVDYGKPLTRDFQSFHYKPIECCEDYSYGVLIHIHYKTPYVFATRFEGQIQPVLTEKNAKKLYVDKLNSILDEIRSQPIETLPF